MQEGVIFTRSASGLVRELSWWDVFFMVIATPAASGILFYSVSTASTYPGASLPIAFLIGMLMFLPICGLIALMSATMPRSASLYISVSRLVDPTIGYLGSFLFFLGYSLTIGVIGFIIIGILGGILVSSGTLGGIQIFKSSGATLQTPLWGAIGGFLWIAFFWFVTLRGIKPYRIVLKIMFFIPMIAILIAIGYFLSQSQASTEVAFNNCWGSDAFQRILSSAKANGWVIPSFSWTSTLGVLLVVIWAYGGIEMVSYAGGEIKIPKRSTTRGFIGGWLVLGLLYIIIAFSVYHPYKEFIAAYDFLYQNHQDILKEIMLPIKPSIPFYITAIIPNPWIGVIIACGITLWFANTMLPFFLGMSRLIFGLAMDRAIPEKLANINPKNVAPTWATHLTAIFALAGVFLSLLDVKIVLGTISFSVFFFLWLYGLSAMLLPYRRQDIYKKSPIKLKFLGIPLITILGFFTFAVGWFIVFFTAKEITTPIAITLVSIMTVGIILYFIQQDKNIKKGVLIAQIYSQIPPE